MRAFLNLLIVIISGLLATLAVADDELIQKYIIEYPDLSDNRILGITLAGDFNIDGYDDLAITIGDYESDRYEAVYLYYGGPDFDTEADLIFVGPEQYSSVEHLSAVGLGDFNGDGYDDMAVNAPGFGFDIGQTYLYFGSPEPDTVADMLLHGDYSGDYFQVGSAGDLNGDSTGDVYAYTGAENGTRFMIYLGSSQPDTIYDLFYDYSSETVYALTFVTGGYDIDGDGYDDLGWGIISQYSDSAYVLLGGDTLIERYSCPVTEHSYKFIGDISEDGADDLYYDAAGGYSYLCLGGTNWDIEPDYLMFIYPDTGDLYLFNPTLSDTVLLVDAYYQDCFRFYHRGIPFDTTIYNEFSYGQNISHFDPIIGDIDADGYGELAVVYTDADLRGTVYIYSTEGSNGIEENNILSLPEQASVITSYPNPFNSSTILSYSSIEGGELRVYDIAGRLVKTLACESDQGNVTWDGTNMSGEKLSSGVYFAKAAKGEHNITTKLVYLK